MNASFVDFYSAAIFAAQMRDQGHFVTILHENAGSMWGGPATGFIVEYSEQPIEHDNDLKVSWRISDTLTTSLCWFMAVLSILISIVIILTGCGYVLHLIESLMRGDWIVIGKATSVAVPVLLGSMASVAFIGVIRNKNHHLHRQFATASYFISIVLCVLMLFYNH